MLTVYILLALIFGVVLFIPFIFKAVEERLEFFLLIAGIAAVSASRSWSGALLQHALSAPLSITLAVFVASILFKLSALKMEQLTRAFAKNFGVKPSAFFLVAMLGLISGLITALVAALALAEAASLMNLSRRSRTRVVVLGCFSIGLGAVLTPLGEPLASITVDRIKGGAHAEDFWFLTRLLGAWVLPLILVLAAAAYALVKPGNENPPSGKRDSYSGLLFRSAKVYLFVVGLEFLGSGFNPATGDLLKSMPAPTLYWAGLVSAVLDNASLAAAGLSPEMSVQQLRYFLLGLMISGGMMVPGNFPNIVCAGKLGINFKEWAKEALPVGIVLMLLVYLILMISG